MSIFEDRVDAGRQLGRRLAELRGQDIVVLGLPRGGVPVAFEVAAALDAPLDVIVVRKLGLPYQPELAMGAIGEGGARVLEEHVLAHARVSDAELQAVEDHERAVLENRVVRFRKGRTRRTSPDASLSLSTTGSPPDPPPGSPAGSPGSSVPRGSSWPFRWPPPTPSAA